MGIEDLDPSTDPPLDVWASGTAEGMQSRATLSAPGGDATAPDGIITQLESPVPASLWYSEQLGPGGSNVMSTIPGPQPWYTLNVSTAGAALSTPTQPQLVQAPWTVAPAAVGGAPGTQVLQVVLPTAPVTATPSPVTQQLVCLPDGTLLAVPPSPQVPQQQPQVVYVIQSPATQQQQQQQQQQVLLVVNPSTPDAPAGGYTPGAQLVAGQPGMLGQAMPTVVTQLPAAAAAPAAAPNGTHTWVMPHQQQQQQQPIVLVVSSPGGSPDLSTAMQTLVLGGSNSNSGSSQAGTGAGSMDPSKGPVQQVVMEPPGLETTAAQPQQHQAATVGASGAPAGGIVLLQGPGQPAASKPGAVTSHTPGAAIVLGHSSEAGGDNQGADSTTSALAAGTGTQSLPGGTAAAGPHTPAATFALMPLESGPAAVLGGCAWGELLVARGALVVLLEVTWGVLTWTHFGAWAAAVCRHRGVLPPRASARGATGSPAAAAGPGGQGQEGGGGSGGGPAAAAGSGQPPALAGLDLVNAVSTTQLLQLLQTWRSAVWTLTHTVAAARRALPSATWARDLSQVLCAADASMAFSCPWDVAETILPQGLARALQLPPPRQSSMSRPPPQAASVTKAADGSYSGGGAAGGVDAELRWEQLPQSFNSALAASHYARNVSLPGLQALVTAGCLPPRPQLVKGSAPQWREMALQARLDYRALKLPFPSRVVPSPQQGVAAYGAPAPRPAYAPAPKRPTTY